MHFFLKFCQQALEGVEVRIVINYRFYVKTERAKSAIGADIYHQKEICSDF